MKKLLILILSLALLLAFAACEWEPIEEEPPEETEVPVEEEEEPVEPVAELPWLTFENYGELYTAIAEVMENDLRYDEAKTSEEPVEYEEDTAEVPAEASPAAEENAAADEAGGMGGADDYSTTNLQVEGVDEADIVKTDGEYIYILRDGQVTVVRAAGADTEAVGSFVVCTPDMENGYEEAQEMYLDDGALDVIVYSYSWQDNRSTGKTCLRRFDVSDPENLGSQVYEVAQDGYYLDSRLLDGTVYLISNYFIFQTPEEDDPATFVPSFYDAKGKAEAFPIEDIAGCPGFSDLQYS
ncbi:MAG: beta-propeller domain-containing protein, partial [Firmicutes bacterium]|nr:beta-propeller domain-containing protein [Bacillota bacterium]